MRQEISDKKGKLIVVDGADGSGKATQTKRLIEHLRAEEHQTETLSFPQYENNFFGHLIRAYLDGHFGDPVKTNPYLASTLYAADRFESSKKIKKWLNKNRIVVLDRYVSANQLHQGSKIKNSEERKNFLKWLDKIEHDIFNIPRPDIIFYLDVSAKTSEKLIADRAYKDKAETNIKHQIESREQSIELIKTSNNWRRILCEENGKILPIEIIHEKIWNALQDMI